MKKKRDLYKEIIILVETTPTPKLENGGARLSANIGNLKNMYIPLHFWTGSGCSGLIKKIKLLWRNVHRNIGAFFICFVSFTITLVYSAVWN